MNGTPVDVRRAAQACQKGAEVLQGLAAMFRLLAGPGPAPDDPYGILGVRPEDPIELVKSVYRAKARHLHPDKGGDAEAFKRLDAAYKAILAQRR